MARWYSAFSNTNIGSLESLSYQRLAMGGTPSALRDDLVNTRQALSNAWQPTVNPQNRNGALGIVIPPSVITRASGNFSFTDLYTNTAAVWQSNPSVRPLTAITTGAPSVQVTPVDGGSFADADYANASAAVQALISNIANIGGGTGGGPYSRLGVNPYATLASLHHDHALTYFAWDDFTPGQPQNFTAVQFGSSISSAIDIDFQWNLQFPRDVASTVNIAGQITRNGGGPTFNFDYNGTAGPLIGRVTIPANSLTAGTYSLGANMKFFDAVVPAHEGPVAIIADTNFMTLS